MSAYVEVLEECPSSRMGIYPNLRMPGHPLATRDGRVRLHRAILFDAIGDGDHRCNWCGKVVVWSLALTDDALVVDHLDFNTTNNALTNLVPSCVSCNSKRRPESDEWDAAQRARKRPLQSYNTHCPSGHAFDSTNTYLNKRGYRICRACCALRKKTQKARSK